MSSAYISMHDYGKAKDQMLLTLEHLSQDFNTQAYVVHQLSLAKIYGKLKEYDKADSLLVLTDEKINNTVSYYHESGKTSLQFRWFVRHGRLHFARENYETAELSFLGCLRLSKELKDSNGIAMTYTNLGNCYMKQGKFQKAIAYSSLAYKYHTKNCPLTCTSSDAYNLYKSYSSLGEHRKALQYYEEYVLLKDSIANEENQRALLNQEYKFAHEKKSFADSLKFAKAQEIKDLEIEKQKAWVRSQRIGLTAAGGGLLLLLALTFSIKRGKRRSDDLLLNILPAETARELKAKGSAESKLIEDTTVLFTDFEGFTAMSENVSPAKLVEDINECFSAFDHIMDKYHVEKIKTIGDAYMAAGGLPTPNSTHVKDVSLAALEIAEFMENWIEKKSEKGEPYFNIRIGLHTGPVVAGIVGVKKFQYDIWGDTVNTASRMESNGQAGKVNISSETYALVMDEPEFTFERRGQLEVKGKGKLEMYFVKQN